MALVICMAVAVVLMPLAVRRWGWGISRFAMRLVRRPVDFIERRSGWPKRRLVRAYEKMVVAGGVLIFVDLWGDGWWIIACSTPVAIWSCVDTIRKFERAVESTYSGDMLPSERVIKWVMNDLLLAVLLMIQAPTISLVDPLWGAGSFLLGFGIAAAVRTIGWPSGKGKRRIRNWAKAKVKALGEKVKGLVPAPSPAPLPA